MTFKCSLKDMKPFFYALGKTYPEQDSFSSLTRQMIEPLLTQPTWIDSRGCTQKISAYRKLCIITSLNVMFTYMQRHEWEGAPVHTLIYEEDRPKRIKKRPHPLPQSVFDQPQANAHRLPPYPHHPFDILTLARSRTADPSQ